MISIYCLLWVLLIALGSVVPQSVDEIDLSNAVNSALLLGDGFVQVVFYKADGSEATLQIEKGDHIHAIWENLCSRVTINNCNEMKVASSYAIYGEMYYRSLLHATKEDFDARRLDVVLFVASYLNVTDYLEIGTFKNEVFNVAASLFPNAIGVDPNEGGTLRMTSDDFFASNTGMFDLIFVDGHHEANQAFRDVHNALKVLRPGGAIVMHDCNPQLLEYEEMRWSGDVWKASVALRLRQDIEIVIADIDCGMGIIRRRPNRHPLPAEWVEHLDVNPISMLTYEMYDKNRFTLQRFMTLNDIREWLAEE